jgi:hypothetical protein
MDQFSFLTPEEYIREFLRHFEIKHVLVKVSPEGLAFRDRHASTWSRLIAAGISETALLIKGLNIVMRKKSNECAPNLA